MPTETQESKGFNFKCFRVRTDLGGETYWSHTRWFLLLQRNRRINEIFITTETKRWKFWTNILSIEKRSYSNQMHGKPPIFLEKLSGNSSFYSDSKHAIESADYGTKTHNQKHARNKKTMNSCHCLVKKIKVLYIQLLTCQWNPNLQRNNYIMLHLI